jgi:hypothetical protein
MASSAITFLNGYSSRNGVLGLLTFPDLLGHKAMFCRLYSYFKGNWGTVDLHFQCKSIINKVDESKGYRGWCVLGKNGEIADIPGGGLPISISQIPGAGLNVIEPYGYVEAIKRIDQELYVCGYGRQAYKLVDDDWVSISDEILTREIATGFFDIDGLHSSHIYAVGWKGEIYFYDGKVWHKDESPTTAHLACVCCIGPDEVWVCGDKGVLLRGNFNRWKILESSAFTDNWYSIQPFNGTIYIAGNDVLAYVENDEIKLVDTGLSKPFTVHKLHAADGLLWAIGRADIHTYDGTTWMKIQHPDNT